MLHILHLTVYSLSKWFQGQFHFSSSCMPMLCGPQVPAHSCAITNQKTIFWSHTKKWFMSGHHCLSSTKYSCQFLPVTCSNKVGDGVNWAEGVSALAPWGHGRGYIWHRGSCLLFLPWIFNWTELSIHCAFHDSGLLNCVPPHSGKSVVCWML